MEKCGFFLRFQSLDGGTLKTQQDMPAGQSWHPFPQLSGRSPRCFFFCWATMGATMENHENLRKLIKMWLKSHQLSKSWTDWVKSYSNMLETVRACAKFRGFPIPDEGKQKRFTKWPWKFWISVLELEWHRVTPILKGFWAMKWVWSRPKYTKTIQIINTSCYASLAKLIMTVNWLLGFRWL